MFSKIVPEKSTESNSQKVEKLKDELGNADAVVIGAGAGLSTAAGLTYFVLTTNVDHQFQLAGFDKKRIFYTQGDYGLWQCSEPCHQKTYDNKEAVRQMIELQKDMKVPTELIPHCPICGKPMSMNLRCDDT